MLEPHVGQLVLGLMRPETSAFAALALFGLIGFGFGFANWRIAMRTLKEWRDDGAAQSKLLDEQREHHKAEALALQNLLHEHSIALFRVHEVMERCDKHMQASTE